MHSRLIGICTAGLLAVLCVWSSGAFGAKARSAPDPARVRTGAGLSHLGYCETCHTGSAGAFAGGVPLRTPFGVVFSTNITPDPATGIGRWSFEDFRRAMQSGVAAGGRRLYPAFPYDHYAKLDQEDVRALWDWLRTRTPIRAEPPGNRLIPPLGFRPLLLVWDLLFLKAGGVAVDPGRSPEWNRGRYLVLGLSHCGGCHTPRNALGAEVETKALDGAVADGWYAPPLNRDSPAVRPWTVEDLYAYLRTGLSRDHAAAAGPMGPVARELRAAPPADVHAIAVYVAALLAPARGARVAERPVSASANERGAALFAGACASCHEAGAGMMLAGRPSLALGTPLHEQSPRDAIMIVLQGLNPPLGRSGPYMPAFADALSDEQLVDLMNYVKARFGGGEWPHLARDVAQARRAAET